MIIIFYYLTSDSDPYWAHADYSIYVGRKLYLKKPHNPSPYLLGLAYRAPARRLRGACESSVVLYYLTF